MTIESNDIHELIAALHAGVDDDSGWLAALDRLSDAFGEAALFIGATYREQKFELSGHRIDPQWIGLVNGPLATHEANPIAATVSKVLREDVPRTVMRPLILSRLLARERFVASPIYRKAIAPAGYDHVMAMVLEADSAHALSLTLVRRAGDEDFDDSAGRLAAAIGPHLLGALRLRYRFAVARSGAILLDCIHQPVMLVSGDGEILHVNEEARRLLAQADGLVVHQGRLRGATSTQSGMIDHLIAECDRAARGVGLAPAGVARLRRPSARPDFVIRGLPLSATLSSTFGVGAAASVALVVHEPDHGVLPMDQLIADGLGLSRAEAAVATRIWEGDSIPQAAVALGLSVNTVKTHLKTIFDTIGVNRQAALVRRIALLVASIGRVQE